MNFYEFVTEHPLSALVGISFFFAFLFFPLLFLIPVAIYGIYSFIKTPSIELDTPQPNNVKPIRGNRLMTTAERNAYFNSPQWQTLRQQVKARDKVCQLTGATDNLEVHHITYDNLGNEYLDDLVLLSRKAHQFVHDYYGSYDRNNTYPITEELRAAYVLNLLNNP